jgi:hypothetical protein
MMPILSCAQHDPIHGEPRFARLARTMKLA